MDELLATIKENRPNIAASTVRTYASYLKNIYKNMRPAAHGEIPPSFFSHNVEDILKYLEDKPNSRKTILSALFILTGCEPYKEQMTKDIDTYKAKLATREMSDTDREKWMTFDEIKALLPPLEHKFKVLSKLPIKSSKIWSEIQQYPLLSVYTRIKPRRLEDYSEFKIRNIIRDTDNYFDDKLNLFVFNKFKTAESHGQERIPVPNDLKLLLKKYIKMLPDNAEYLFFKDGFGKLSTSVLNKRIQGILGDTRSVNVIRKAYLTDTFGDTINQYEKLEEAMKEMGSSTANINNYIKKTP